MVDEESVGSASGPGCGGIVLRGNGALETYLAKPRFKDQRVKFGIIYVLIDFFTRKPIE